MMPVIMKCEKLLLPVHVTRISPVANSGTHSCCNAGIWNTRVDLPSRI